MSQPTGPEAYAATLQHALLVRRKIVKLEQALGDAMQQLYTSAEREYRAGRASLDDLGDLYESARELGTGFASSWDQHVGITAAAIRSHNRSRPPSSDGARTVFWSGPYPYEDGFPRPVRGVSVVYVLYDALNEPIYLGSTSNFTKRLSRHRKDKPVAWWLAFPCGTREAAYLMEVGLLGARKPPLNVKVGR